MKRFWIFLSIAVASPLVLIVLRQLDFTLSREDVPRDVLTSRASRQRALRRMARPDHRTRIPGNNSATLNIVLFDVASVGIGLCMAMFARRFAPIFYILATPAIASWIVHLARPLSVATRRIGWIVVTCGAWAGAVLAIGVTSYYAYEELEDHIPGDRAYDLLDRVTCNYRTPLPCLEFMQRNGLTPNVMTEWKVAAAIMFYVPGARVFIDGRAQQVYTEDHFKAYMGLLNVPPPQAGAACDLLDRFKTDAVLLPKWSGSEALRIALNQQPRWLVAFEEPLGTIWVRRDSPLLDDLTRRQRAGSLWLPTGAQAQPVRQTPASHPGR